MYFNYTGLKMFVLVFMSDQHQTCLIILIIQAEE